MKKTVMIVDDSLFVTAEMKGMLQDSDFTVIGEVRSGEEALAAFEQLRPDVLTMDIVLPGMDGIETTAALLRKWPETKVLVISSLAYDDTVRKAQLVGATGFLFKPFHTEALLDALRKASE